MKLALVGLGGAAEHGHLPALRLLEAAGRLRLIAAADRSPARLRSLGPALPRVRMFTSAKEMLRAVELDVLVVATEPGGHAELVELAFAQGVHVVCEKPLIHTEDHREVVEVATKSRPDLALVSVHQYRYSSTWIRLAPAIRIVNSLRLPFSALAEVCRHGVEDPHAASSWRADLARSGGLLADHGAHFIALLWRVDPEMEVLGGGRHWHAPGRERSWGRVRIGSGALDLHMSTLVDRRFTRLRVSGSGVALDWQGGRASLRVKGRRGAAWLAADLSDRTYLDSLYLPFYEDLTRNLSDPAWRARRTAESLGVSRVLVELLRRVTGLESVGHGRVSRH